MTFLTGLIDSPWFLAFLILQAVVSLAILLYDVRTKNRNMPSMMKWVWGFSVAYSGLFGLTIYWLSGRPGISDDNNWRRGFRSTAHCYSGCGAGEITGIIIAIGILSLGNLYVALMTFTLAYVAGYTLTVLPMMQEGVSFKTALKDAFYTETASIAVMEIVAISVDLTIAGEATMSDPRFWTALIISLSVGFLAAWPVNYWLIRKGVKSGMGDPREYGQSQSA